MRSQKLFLLVALALGTTAFGCGGEEKSDDKPGYTCSNCSSDQICDTTTGTCVGCLNDTNCSAPTTICRTNDHVCVECLTKDDCAGDMVCNMGKCEGESEEVACDAENPCPNDGDECQNGTCITNRECSKETEATDCPGSECTTDNKCLNSKKVNCDASGVPAHASATAEQVNVAWTSSSGWTKTPACEWSCNDGYLINAKKDGCEKAPDCTSENEATVCPGSECTNAGTCLTSKKVNCDSSSTPEHALAVHAQETISWSSESGWSDPGACKWNCVDGYVLNAKKDGCDVAPECTDNQDCTPNGECNGGSCLSQKTVSCLTPASALPHGASYVIRDVIVTWTAGSGWTTAETCEWLCTPPYITEGNQCKEPPECTSNDDCRPDGECVQNACLTSKKVDCVQSGKPNHASYKTGKVTVTWTAGKGWTTPAQCEWSCNSGHEPSTDGKSCVEIETCTPGTCTDNVYCNDQHKENDCSKNSTKNLCKPNKGCVQCLNNDVCTDGNYCNQSTGNCNKVECTGCKKTYEACDTSNPTIDGKGQCVPASCNKTQCTSDYACIDGVYTFCENGCANNACKPAAVGCAAQANPDEWCILNSSEAVCELSSGNCVECLKDSDCGNGKECNATTHVCQNKCGNGKLDAGEECESNIPQSQWTKKCEDLNYIDPYTTLIFVGEVTCGNDCKVDNTKCTLCGNGRIDGKDAGREECDPQVSKTEWIYASCSEFDSTMAGEVSCNNDCTMNVDACVDNGDPCNGLKADEECSSYNGSHPQPCDVFFDDFTGAVYSDRTIVCKPASEQCTSKLVIDDAATEANCYVPEQQPVKVGWCSVYPVYGSNYSVELNDSNRTKTLYAKVNVAGETGTSGAHSSALQANLLIYTTDGPDLVKTIPATRNVGWNGGGSDANDEWQATISLSDFPKSEMYYYEWSFTGDSGLSWYGCKESCDGADCAYLGQDIHEDYLIMVEKPAAKMYFTDFEWITNINQNYTNSENTTAGGITWSFMGRTNLINSSTDYAVDGKGVMLRQNDKTWISASGMKGVSGISFSYKYWDKPDIKVCTKAQESDANCLEDVKADMSSKDTSTEPGFGMATFTAASAGASYVVIRTNGTENATRIVIDNVEVQE